MDLAESPLAATPADNRRGLTPEFEAAGAIELTDALAESHRRLGFTSILSVPGGAIATGQSALVTLSGLPRRESIVKAPVALHIHLAQPSEPTSAATPGRPETPNQPGPMPGVMRRRFAAEQGGTENPYPAHSWAWWRHLRQAMLDAEYHQKLVDLDQRGSSIRTPYDPALKTLWQARGRMLPVWWQADTRDEIHRALDLATEFGTTAVIVGGREAAKVIDRLKAEHVSVILPLSFAEEPRVPTEDEYRKRPTPEQDDPLKLLVHRHDRWKEQVATAAALAKAGIPFAFATEGLERLDSFPARLRALIAHGLTADQALAGLTTQAATIAGLERKLGTLEPGKLGHVVAFTAPFQDEQAKARFVLIDGLKFEVKAVEPGAPEGRPGARRGGPRGEARPGGQERFSGTPGGPRPDRRLVRRSGRPRRRLAASRKPSKPGAGSPPADAKKEGAHPPRGVQELAQAKPKEASPSDKQPTTPSPAEPRSKEAKPSEKAAPKPVAPAASDKPKSEPAGGHGPPPAGKPASPEPKAAEKPFVDVATEFDADRLPRLKTGGSVLIKDATILTVTHGTIARGSILVEHGKISAVGPAVKGNRA